MSNKNTAADRLAWYRRMGIPLGPQSTLIDVGAGSGCDAVDFSYLVGTVIAIDANASVPPRASLPQNVEWVVGELPDSTLMEQGIADFVFVNSVLEHVDPQNISDFVQACCDLLKPGGGAWFSWASLYSNVGSHTGNALKGWEHLLHWDNSAAWHALLDERLGNGRGDRWFNQEWRPGLTREDWLEWKEPHASLMEVAEAISGRFEVLKHNMVCDDDGRLWRERKDLEISDLMRISPSYHDLICTSDTWLVRKPAAE
jgi:SAM-dependent methyltransferase